MSKDLVKYLSSLCQVLATKMNNSALQQDENRKKLVYNKTGDDK